MYLTSHRCVLLLTDLEVDPGFQLPAAVEQTQQAGAGDAVGAARHAAPPTRHPAEHAVLVFTQQPRPTNQRHRAVHLGGGEKIKDLKHKRVRTL